MQKTHIPILSCLLFISGMLILLLVIYDGWLELGKTVDNSPGNTSASTYYVAKNGNDSNPGTEARPWLTIQKAADTAIAGDTVYIKEGTYNERIVVKNSGNDGKWITFAAYHTYAVTIDGDGISIEQNNGLFQITGKQYIKVSGFRIVNSNGAGISMRSSSNIIIQKNYIYDPAKSGITAYGSRLRKEGFNTNITIDGNTVTRPSKTSISKSNWAEGISMAAVEGFEVKNNEVYKFYGEGIITKDGSQNGKVYKNQVHHALSPVNTGHAPAGIYIDSYGDYAHDIDVYQNVVHDYNYGFEFGSEQGALLENVRMYDNIAYNNWRVGFLVSNYHEPGKPKPQMKNISILNNVIYNNGIKEGDNWGGGIFIQNFPLDNLQNAIVRNNIISQNKDFQISTESSFVTPDHNLIDGFRGKPGETYGIYYVEANPRFINPAGADFHLKGTSPAIDKGLAYGVPSIDFDGNSRPKGAGYDIGAFEYRK